MATVEAFIGDLVNTDKLERARRAGGMACENQVQCPDMAMGVICSRPHRGELKAQYFARCYAEGDARIKSRGSILTLRVETTKADVAPRGSVMLKNGPSAYRRCSLRTRKSVGVTRVDP